MQNFWERKATVIRRNDESYHADFFSTKQLAEIIERNPIQFGVNLNITSYDVKTGRQTHDPPGQGFEKQFKFETFKFQESFFKKKFATFFWIKIYFLHVIEQEM